jgi:GTP-binding protein HflX
VVDITHPNACLQGDTVLETLAELGVVDRPIVVALNKIDRLPQPVAALDCLDEFPDSVAVSAREGTGLDTLLVRVEELLAAEMVQVVVQIPYERGDLAALFHERGTVLTMTHDGQGTALEGYLPRRWLEQFRPYVVQASGVR